MLKQAAFENPIERHRADNFRAVEVHTTDFGVGQKPLRVGSEQQDGGFCRCSINYQAEMVHHIGHRCSFGQGKLTLLARASHKSGDSVGI